MKKTEQQKMLEELSRGAIEYLMKNMNDFMRFMEIRNLTTTESEESALHDVEEMEYNSRAAKKQIVYYLHLLGIPNNVKGFTYLCEAIEIYLEEDSNTFMVSKDVYPQIAKKHKATITAVDRGIRNSIAMAWKKAEAEDLKRIFGYTPGSNKGRPTSAEFIATIASQIYEYYDFGTSKQVKKYLHMMAIPCNMNGYKYLVEAVLIKLNNDKIDYQEIYAIIAEKHNTTICGVERAIRYASKIGTDRADPDNMKEIFGNRYILSPKEICNSEVITTLAYITRNDFS